MNNLDKVTENKQLNAIFENCADKLIVLLFYTKNIPKCRQAVPLLETSASNHQTTLFYIVDVDKCVPDGRYIKNIDHMPSVDIYYSGNKLGSYPINNSKDIEQYVQIAERHILTQNKSQNINTPMNSIHSMNPQMNPTMNPVMNPAMNPAMNPQINPMNPPYNQQSMSPLQLQQQILYNAQMQNPSQYQFLISNPEYLQHMVQQQMQMYTPQTNLPQPNIAPIHKPLVPDTQTIAQFVNSPQMVNNSDALPTLNQMQKMFQIFQMMQQMGLIAIPTLNKSTQNIETVNQIQNAITLPNGDKLIPLPGQPGKYGLIKNPSNK